MQKVIIPTENTLNPLFIIDFNEIFRPIPAIANNKEYLLIIFKIGIKKEGIRL
jgi:hypothetical protein